MSAADSRGYWAEGSRLVLRHAGNFFTPRRRVVLTATVVLTAVFCALLFMGALLWQADGYWIVLFDTEIAGLVLAVVLTSAWMSACTCLFVWGRLEKNGRAPAMTKASRATVSRAIRELLQADREGRTASIDPGDLRIVAELVTYVRRALPTPILANLLATTIIIPTLVPTVLGLPIGLLGLFFLVPATVALFSLRALGQTSALLRVMPATSGGDEQLP